MWAIRDISNDRTNIPLVWKLLPPLPLPSSPHPILKHSHIKASHSATQPIRSFSSISRQRKNVCVHFSTYHIVDSCQWHNIFTASAHWYAWDRTQSTDFRLKISRFICSREREKKKMECTQTIPNYCTLAWNKCEANIKTVNSLQ